MLTVPPQQSHQPPSLPRSCLCATLSILCLLFYPWGHCRPDSSAQPPPVTQKSILLHPSTPLQPPRATPIAAKNPISLLDKCVKSHSCLATVQWLNSIMYHGVKKKRKAEVLPSVQGENHLPWPFFQWVMEGGGKRSLEAIFFIREQVDN